MKRQQPKAAQPSMETEVQLPPLPGGMTVDAASILRQAAEDVAGHDTGGGAIGLVMGLNEVRRGLARLAARAIQLEDEELLQELLRLGCIHPAP